MILVGMILNAFQATHLSAQSNKQFLFLSYVLHHAHNEGPKIANDLSALM